MTIFANILGIIGFIFAIFFAFFIPGKVLLGKVNFPILIDWAVSVIIGLVLWALQGIVLGFLQIRWASYLYLLIFLGLFIWKRRQLLPNKFSIWKWDIPSIVIVGIGIIGQILPYVQTGWQTSQGILFTAHNPEDHIWHASLVKELVQRFPPNEPSIAGVKLLDYHYFYNLVTADLIRVFHLPFFSTQFDGMYILAPILLGIIAYGVSQKLWKSALFTRFFLFLLYFSGNAAGWVMLLMRHSFNWNLSSLIIDASKFMDSPPYGYAVVIGLAGFYLLLQKDNLSKKMLSLCVLLFGCLLEFKVYVGIPFIFAFGAFSFANLFKKKYMPFLFFMLTGIFAYGLLKLSSSSSAGLIFLPVDIPRDFINQPLLQLRDWQLRWIIFQDHHNLVRLIQYGFMMSGLYLLIQFGLLLLGLIPLPITVKKLGFANSFFLYGGVLSAFILGLFFYQTVGGANIWEFFVAAFPLVGLMFAFLITVVLEKRSKILQNIVISLIAIMVIPQWFISVNTYISEAFLSGFHGVTNDQISSFSYLNNTSINSLIFLANQPVYSYASITNLFVDRSLYLSGNGVRQIVTPEIAKRRKEEIIVSTGKNSQEISQILQSEKIKYVYFYGKSMNFEVLRTAGLNIVFANGAATIFQVK